MYTTTRTEPKYIILERAAAQQILNYLTRPELPVSRQELTEHLADMLKDPIIDQEPISQPEDAAKILLPIAGTLPQEHLF